MKNNEMILPSVVVYEYEGGHVPVGCLPSFRHGGVWVWGGRAGRLGRLDRLENVVLI